MYTKIYLLAIVLVVYSSQASARSLSATAELAYQEGLFHQRTDGNLDRAMAAYDRALEAATDAENGNLVESILLRRSEVFKLQGRSTELESTIAAFRKKTEAKDAVLGPARFFPPESEIIVHIDLTKLWAAPLLNDLGIKDEIKIDNLDQLTGLLGFNPLKDLRQVTIGANLPEDENKLPKHWLIQVKGNLKKFDPVKLVESQKKQLTNLVLKTHTIHGVKVLSYRIPLDQDPKQMMTVGLARLDDTTVLAGDLKGLEYTLAARAGKNPGLRANPKLVQITSRIPENTTFWIAGTLKRVMAKIKELDELPFLPKNLPELEGVLLTGTLTENVSVSATTWVADKQSAKMLGDILAGLLALAHLAPVDEPLAKEAINSLTVKTEDRQITISARLPGKLIASAFHENQPEIKAKQIVMKVGAQNAMSYPGISKLIVGDPKVADIKLVGKDSFILFGVGAGETNMLVKRRDKPDLSFQIVVTK
ncbi:MAG: pilus assembly protein N-terminal domain-containing protein [Deltaproteobacteria bacterium]|nr:pilus assembly protein N-terminal domain-containing protein [Deltaproteobacteria bacterium]